jgi:putative transposase
MDEIYFRDKAAMCLRLIQGLSPNNPGRFQLLELAKAFYWLTAFFDDMKRRGLNDPLLLTSDGAPGIIKAIEICFPRAARQRCLAHRMRNLAVKVPEDVWPEFKVRAQAAYQAPSRAIARELAAGVVADYGSRYDSAVACFMDDFESCIAHLRFPVTHRRAIRTTNLLERLFVEERRRLKIIPNAFGERAVLKLMFGAGGRPFRN